MRKNIVHLSDCLLGMKSLPTSSIDCCVTDPPYGIRFMNQGWDYNLPSVELWQEVLRILKPGAHALVACGTKTQHRMVVNLEDAGFNVRDVITWHYGSGFPKSQDLGKAHDKKYGGSPKVSPREATSPFMNSKSNRESFGPKANLSAKANRVLPNPADKPTTGPNPLNGWGTALKPATEFWTLVRKPIAGKTILDNAIQYGVGGLNVDASRIHAPDAKGGPYIVRRLKTGGELNKTGGNWRPDAAKGELFHGNQKPGRFPANLILDEYTAGLLDGLSGQLKSGKPEGIKGGKNKGIYGKYAGGQPLTGFGDQGGASRFFYIAKASQEERGEANRHPTVKPVSLMTYLIRMICPIEPGRIVLDPFAGSGSTCIAARGLGVDFVAFEISKEYVTIAEGRLKRAFGMFYDQ